MDAIEDACEEDEAMLPDILCTFHQWMMKDPTRKENTARSYVRQMAMLFEDDGKSPKGMATDEYFQLTKSSIKNKSGNGQRSAAVKQFIPFWQEMGNGPFEPANDVKTYQVKARGTGQRMPRLMSKVQAEETNEEKKVRADWGLQGYDDWKVTIVRRHSADLIAAVSPSGTAYKTHKAVQLRLAGGPGNVGAGAVSSSTPAPAKNGEGGASSSAPPKPPKPPKETPQKIEPKIEPKVEPKVAPVPVPEPEPMGPITKRVPLTEAVAMLKAQLGDAVSTAETVLLVHGRDASAPLAQRLNGLYVREAPGEAEELPVYKKFRALKKPTVLFYIDDKTKGGLWKFSSATNASGGGFARNKINRDKAERPWLVQKPWRVFHKEAADFEEDPSMKTSLLDVDTAIPPELEKETVEVDEEEDPGHHPPNNGGGGSSSSVPARHEDLEDAPEDHIAWNKVKIDHRTRRCQFEHVLNGEKVRFQTVFSGTGGDADLAARICRLCFLRFEAGDTKDVVAQYRNSLYQRLAGNGGGASLDHEASEVKIKKEKHGEHKEKKRKHDEPKNGNTSTNGSATKKIKSEGDVKDEVKNENVKAELEDEVKGELADKAAGDSDSDSDSSSSSSSDGTTASTPASIAAAGSVAAPVPVIRNPNALGRLCAKMSVRTGHRCYTHYEARCTKCK